MPGVQCGSENFEPLDSASDRKGPLRRVRRCSTGRNRCVPSATGPEHYVLVDQGQPAGKVRCTICKEVFDASENSCPVCGVGPEYF